MWSAIDDDRVRLARRPRGRARAAMTKVDGNVLNPLPLTILHGLEGVGARTSAFWDVDRSQRLLRFHREVGEVSGGVSLATAAIGPKSRSYADIRARWNSQESQDARLARRRCQLQSPGIPDENV